MYTARDVLYGRADEIPRNFFIRSNDKKKKKCRVVFHVHEEYNRILFFTGSQTRRSVRYEITQPRSFVPSSPIYMRDAGPLRRGATTRECALGGASTGRRAVVERPLRGSARRNIITIITPAGIPGNGDAPMLLYWCTAGVVWALPDWRTRTAVEGARACAAAAPLHAASVGRSAARGPPFVPRKPRSVCVRRLAFRVVR